MRQGDFQRTPRLPKGTGRYRSELEEQLIKWANLNSGSHNPACLEQAAQTLTDTLDSQLPVDAGVLRDPQSQSLLALLRKQERPQTPRVLLHGHLDTVYSPEPDFQNCTYPSDRKTINGPGVTDMKVGIS
ncbi:hypothetical protein [Pelagicoccus sp. SDUM812002]|uniref:hypothetical protein n=1 Tax=Pelagicoccus sp. SDUM812002 TaxID=3041266 RepID=UPI00280E6A8B|nr:hypothetical protein [Pelagicoccus sp. SDUM812002]MDQ8184571.1 hypothetical protein [Pelagicoccus sp. SDUM812002]